MRIKINRSLCIGAGTCASLAPNTFELDDELKAVLKQGKTRDKDEDILAAAKSCPVMAIVLEDENGRQICP